MVEAEWKWTSVGRLGWLFLCLLGTLVLHEVRSCDASCTLQNSASSV